MFIVFHLVLAVFFLGFHALLYLLLFCGVAKELQEVNDLHILVHSLIEGILHPFVGLAANVYEYIARRDAHDIACSGLIVMQVGAAAQQIGHISLVCMVAHYLLYPVVLGEDGADHAELARGLCSAR